MPSRAFLPGGFGSSDKEFNVIYLLENNGTYSVSFSLQRRLSPCMLIFRLLLWRGRQSVAASRRAQPGGGPENGHFAFEPVFVGQNGGIPDKADQLKLNPQAAKSLRSAMSIRVLVERGS
jgi:hypothetical protein